MDTILEEMSGIRQVVNCAQKACDRVNNKDMEGVGNRNPMSPEMAAVFRNHENGPRGTPALPARPTETTGEPSQVERRTANTSDGAQGIRFNPAMYIEAIEKEGRTQEDNRQSRNSFWESGYGGNHRNPGGPQHQEGHSRNRLPMLASY